MDVMLVAAIGIAVVLISILVVRLHPLLGLLLGSLFLFSATPRAIQIDNELADRRVSVIGLASGGLVALDAVVEPGSFRAWNDIDNSAAAVQLVPATDGQLQRALERGGLSPANAVWLQVGGGETSITRGMQLVAEADLRSFESNRWSNIGGQLADGFAKTFRKLGIPVTMAAIVGVCLLESGAAARLVAAIMFLFGPRGTAPALTVSGFILGVPVFFDNVFYLLLPLAKAVGRQRPEKYLAAVMAIIVGATMAHSLVPPTPGPLLVAAAMKISVGMMMIAGFIVGGAAACVGFTYGMFCSRWIKLVPDSGAESGAPVARQSEHRIPLVFAALPIAVPILALGGSEIAAAMAAGRPSDSKWTQLEAFFALFNDPGLIFIGTALIAIVLLRVYSSREVVGKSVARGISDAGTIVLLTCAGGAFGAALQQLQLNVAISSRFADLTTPWSMLLTAFLLTTVIRAAQGSATVAMITSAAIVAPFLETIEIPFHPVYVALAIGCGSKPLPWMNDSGFWQVATMTGLSTTQTLQSFSVALTLMGISGFMVTLLGAWLLPLV